ncbi:DUF4270 family protein [Hymenobacter sp. 102]|uniref:DUF4270 family protein n=1 Tax=Hymenobacter sp. 102 TaxID=3403152 RepID=UPI003CEE332F
MCLLALATGCEEANDLGLELPGTSPISATYLDLPVTSSTVRQQPVETVRANQILVGRLRDSFVGTTTASGFSNITVVASGDTIPATFSAHRLDSTVISLPFSTVYGSATQPLRLDLKTLQQPLDERVTYNSASSVATGNSLLTNFEAPLNKTRLLKQRVGSGNGADTTTTVVTTTTPDQVVRIRMQRYPSTASLATAVFAELKNGTPTQSKLNALWAGISLQPSAGHEANIAAFSANAAAAITFYYTATSAKGAVRSHFYRLPLAFGLSSVPGKYFTQLTTDLAGSPLAALTSAQSAIPAASTSGLTYVQEGTGLGTRIEFQGLDDLRNNTSLVINRAELIFPVKQYSNGLFPYPNNLYLYEVNSANEVLTRTVGGTTYERLVPGEGVNPVTKTELLTPVSVGPGTQATVYIPAGQSPVQYYTVAITEYLQAYLQNRLNGELPTGLILSPILRSDFNLRLNRAQLDANNIKLRVYYSKLR